MATAIPDEGFRPSQLFNPAYVSGTPTSTSNPPNTSPIHGLPTIDTTGVKPETSLFSPMPNRY